jgi:hypothetical protein
MPYPLYARCSAIATARAARALVWPRLPSVSAPHMGVCRASDPVGLFVLSVRFGPGSVLHTPFVF